MKSSTRFGAALVVATALGATACQTAAPDSAQLEMGERLFAQRCESCHTSPLATSSFIRVGRPPPPDLMAQMDPDAILLSLTSGKMASHGARLSSEEKTAIVAWLTGRMPDGEIQ